MLDPRGNPMDLRRTTKEVPPRTVRLLATEYEDHFWGDLAKRMNYARRVKEGAFRFPNREARKFWMDLERTFFTNPRPRGA